MALFWTNLPIQSWAPMTMSGPLPALSAVMKLVWRSLATTCTATVNPPCWSAHCVANSSIEGAFFSSAQMTRSAVVSAATASPPSEDALPPPLGVGVIGVGAAGRGGESAGDGGHGQE